jgi:hypothetical protein
VVEDVEIDFRDVDFDSERGIWGWNDGMQERSVIIVNTGHVVPDVY